MNRRCDILATFLAMLTVAATGCANRANAQDPDLKPTFGSVTLKADFQPDPHEKKLNAGGTIQTNLGGVKAYVEKAPDYKLFYTAGRFVLTIYVDSTAATTLLVNLPDGTWVAAGSDPKKGIKPVLQFAKPQSGRYDIWVGTVGKELAPATLKITELNVAVAAKPRPGLGNAMSKDEVDREWNRAYGLATQGQYADVAAIYEHMLPSAERVYAKDGASLASIVENLADAYAVLGEFGKAEPHFRRALKLRESSLGKDDLQVARSLTNLGVLYLDMGQFDKVEPLQLRALRIREAKLGKDHPDVALSLLNLGTLYRSIGEYAKVEPILQRSLQIRVASLGKDHLDVAYTLNGLALLYWNLGQYPKAEVLYQRALQIREAKLGKDHHDVALSLNDLGLLYRDMGQSAKAEPLLLRCIQIREARLGKDHPFLGFALSNLANLYRDEKQYAKSEALQLRSLQILEARLGKDNLHVAATLNNLAVLYLDTEQYDKVEPLCQRALQILEANLGKDHPELAEPLNNLANVYGVRGKNAKAEELMGRCLRITEDRFGKDHPNVGKFLANRAWELAFQKKWGPAIQDLQRARENTVFHLAETFPTLSENEQLKFLEKNFAHDFHGALSIACFVPSEGAGPAAEWLLNGKAIAHQSLAEQQILARNAASPDAKRLLADLQNTRTRLASLINRAPLPGMENDRLQQIEALKKGEQELAQKLARAVGRPYRANPWVKLDELRARLGAKTAFVDIVRFPVFDLGKQIQQAPHYVACITPPSGKGDVQLIDLGDAEPIDRLIQETRKTLIDSAKTITKVGEVEALNALQKPLKELSAKVLHPLLPAIQKYEEWIVCPDGALWLMPWNALLLPKGEFAVEKHLIRHVVSGRDLVLELPKTKAESAYVFADPDYDLSPTKATSSASGTNDPTRALGSLATLPRVPRLPGTAVEAEAIRPKLKQWLGQEPNVFLEDKASEAMVKSVKNPRVLTVATHGYFLPTQQVEAKERPGSPLGESNRSVALVDAKGQPIENPLLRCGLLLAGCNRRAEAKPGEDDGILTGLEIVGMDLQGCELVVLSACETGLGDVRNGEGVAGLRQAFQLAGAKSVLASLWQVSDRETALLMNAFYDELAKGKSQAESLRQAQLQRIASRRAGFGAAHPFFWSPFALTSRGTD